MKLSAWLVLPLVIGLSSMTVACDAGGDPETDEPLETAPSQAEPLEDEDEDEETEEDETEEDGEDD